MNENTFDTYSHTYSQGSPYKGPRPANEVLLEAMFSVAWGLFCRWTPKPLNGWRLMWLRLFGADLNGTPFVHQSARIHVPWNLIMHDKSALGERATVYSLGVVELKARCTVAQEVYLCAASHDFKKTSLPLVTAKITLGEDSFICARAFVMPGVTIGTGTVVGACSVVTKDLPDWMFAAGNPCKIIRPRVINN